MAVAAAIGCDGGGSGELVWVKRPTIARQQTLPRDRVLLGIVRNDSLRRVTLEAKDVRAVDEDGATLKGNATFIRGYVHPL